MKAILCEKPVYVTLADADRMVEACGENGVAYGAGDMCRNMPQLWQAREIIESGEIGAVRSINNFGPVGSGGGCQGLSVIRLFAWDANVEWIVGWVNGEPADQFLDRPIDAFSDHDQGLGGVIRFSNGIDAFIHESRTARKGIGVVCERGNFVNDYRTFHLYRLAEGTDPRRLRWHNLSENEGMFEDSIGFGPWQADGWQHMSTRQAATVQSMVDTLDKGFEPRASGDNGRLVLEMAIALRESERRSFAPVTIPIEDCSLQIIPARSRMYWKKEVYGEEWYAKQMAQHKRGTGDGV